MKMPAIVPVALVFLVAALLLLLFEPVQAGGRPKHHRVAIARAVALTGPAAVSCGEATAVPEEDAEGETPEQAEETAAEERQLVEEGYYP